MSDTKRILLVDDEEDIIDFLQVLLEGEGYEVITASNGQEGLDTARDEKPHLIISDVMMPVMDGYQMTRLLKFDEDVKDIPVIILSARGQDKDVQTGKSMGANEYLPKPLEEETILEAVKKYI